MTEQLSYNTYRFEIKEKVEALLGDFAVVQVRDNKNLN